jgi:hypothetical protein
MKYNALASDRLRQVTAPAALAIAGVFDTIACLSRRAQLRSLRLSLTDMPPHTVDALGNSTVGLSPAMQQQVRTPWVMRLAGAAQLTRLALGGE